MIVVVMPGIVLRSRLSAADCVDAEMQQVSDSFPFKWINKKWKEGFYVTSMATSHTRWAVVMSRNAGFIDQVNLLSMRALASLSCDYLRE